MKSKNRSLRQQIEDVASQSAKPPLHGWSASQGVHPQDPFVQAHIKELNGTIGKNPTRHVLDYKLTGRKNTLLLLLPWIDFRRRILFSLI